MVPRQGEGLAKGTGFEAAHQRRGGPGLRRVLRPNITRLGAEARGRDSVALAHCSPPAGALRTGEPGTGLGAGLGARPSPRPRRRAERRPPSWASAVRRCASTRASSASKPCARPSAALSRSPSSAASARAVSSFSSRLRTLSSCCFSVPRASSSEPSRPRSRARNSPSCSCSFRWAP